MTLNPDKNGDGEVTQTLMHSLMFFRFCSEEASHGPVSRVLISTTLYQLYH